MAVISFIHSSRCRMLLLIIAPVRFMMTWAFMHCEAQIWDKASFTLELRLHVRWNNYSNHCTCAVFSWPTVKNEWERINPLLFFSYRFTNFSFFVFCYFFNLENLHNSFIANTKKNLWRFWEPFYSKHICPASTITSHENGRPFL